MLSLLSPAWRSGAVDVPRLLAAVQLAEDENARRGADEALGWLGTPYTAASWSSRTSATTR